MAMGLGALAAGEVGNVILYVEGLYVEAMWILEANMSDSIGEGDERHVASHLR
jgi:hypothetical protein